MSFSQLMERAAQAFELAGTAVLVSGFALAAAVAARAWRTATTTPDRAAAGYEALRRCFGGALLLGLEILVAADLIRTVAVSPSLHNVAALGVVVLIRTFLSFSLEVEIEGVAPWRRRRFRTEVPKPGRELADRGPPLPSSGLDSAVRCLGEDDR